MTIRERIKTIADAMRDDSPSPADLRTFEVTLAGLLWNITDEVRRAEMDFRMAIVAAGVTAKSATAAKQIAEGGPCFGRLLEARATHESCMEMLRTCRSSIRSVSEEMRLAGR